MTTPVQITVFAKTTGCQQCVATKKQLDRQGTPYKVRYVDQDPAAADEVALLGYRAVPVVVAGDMHWTGFRHDRLIALGQLHAATTDVTELDTAAEQYLAEEGAA